jgi:N-acylglucosamine-6-phosphate 2-epimerase
VCSSDLDIASLKEAIDCEQAGSDFISTTLYGYTPKTKRNQLKPNLILVERLINSVSLPIIAEGRISTTTELRKIKAMGAHGAVVGSAITRPRLITQKLVHSFK